MDQSRQSLDVRPTRASLDVRPSRLSLDVRPRASLDSRSPRFPPTVKDVEEPKDSDFEEVKLNDDPRPKRSIFHRFGGDHSSGTSVLGKTGLFARKDPASGSANSHGSELAPIDRASFDGGARD